MPVSDVTSATQSKSASAAASSAANLNFDTFIKLLTTQLQHQDPLNPMDGTAFTEQIATFSALEQQIATNSHLEKLVQADSFGAQSLAVSYIGKEALVPGSQTQLENGEMPFTYTMDKRAVYSEIKIVDSFGSIVKTLEGELTEGTHEVVWDGTNEDGDPLADGTYTIFIEAAGADGNIVPVEIFSFAKIYAMEAEGENINLVTEDGKTVNFNSVLQVREAKEQDEQTSS
jgi:flagellar basal-body rod modification protein FlgD